MGGVETETMSQIREGLRVQTRQADVVIFRSGLSDVRSLCEWLERYEVDHVVIEMAMGSSWERSRFSELKSMTGWPTLPQIFIQGEFVGGEREFFSHPFLRKGPETSVPTAGHGTDPRLSVWLSPLGYGGVIPFVAGLLGVSFLDDPTLRQTLQFLLLAYGAVILSFLGAIHWGRILLVPQPHADAGRTLVYGMFPSVAGWLTLLLPFAFAAPLQAVLFAAVYAVDHRLIGGVAVRRMYLPLRRRLTLLVIVLLAASWLVELFRGLAF